jgi:hypothetical protein
MTKCNPSVQESRDGGFRVYFSHPTRGSYVWCGVESVPAWYSHFGGGVGMVRMRDGELYPTREAAEKAVREEILPWTLEFRSWEDYIRGWE